MRRLARHEIDPAGEALREELQGVSEIAGVHRHIGEAFIDDVQGR